MEAISQPNLESQILAVLQARPDILRAYVEECVEDLLFGSPIKRSGGSEYQYMSYEELKKVLSEDCEKQKKLHEQV